MVNFIVLIILHLLGDFYLQTSKIAKCKNARKNVACNKCTKCKENSKFNVKYLVLHILLYSIPFLVLFFMTNWFEAIKNILEIGLLLFKKICRWIHGKENIFPLSHQIIRHHIHILIR